MSTCLCVPLCAFYLLTLRTGIPVPRTCRLSSQRDTERGQSEQRSFVRRECGHEKFGKRHGLRNITKLLLKSPLGRKPSTFDIGAWGWPYVCYLASDSGRLHRTATVHSAWELTPRKKCTLSDKCQRWVTFLVWNVLQNTTCDWRSEGAGRGLYSPSICPTDVPLSSTGNSSLLHTVV